MSGRSRDEIIKSERRLRAMIEHGKDVLALVEETGKILYVSPSVHRVLGYEPRALVGTDGFLLQHPEQDEVNRDILTEVVVTNDAHVRHELKVRNQRGEWRDFELEITNMLDDPQIEAVVVTGRDVTDQRRVMRELAESETRFRRLVENARDIISMYELTPTPRMVFISPSAERITGYPLQMFYEDPNLHFKLIHPDDRPKLQRLMGASLEELTKPTTLRWIRKDGKTVWMEQLLVLILDDDGELIGTQNISREVTAQVRLEEQLRRSQKLEAVGRLAGGIAHDFNNLLGAVMLSAQRLARSAGPSMREGLDTILEATRRGADLTQQLLSFSRRTPVNAMSLSLNEVVGAMTPILRRLIREDIRITMQLEATADTLEIDRSQLEQVILNLAVNARDSMPRGGELTIATGNSIARAEGRARTEIIPLPSDDTLVSLVVSDTGDGIADDDRDRLFEPFFTTKADGSGLGLSVVHGIVQEYGGTIDVESSPGQGATFCIRWPAAPADGIERAPKPSPMHVTGSGTILVVEDEEVLRNLTARMLQDRGYEVVCAANGAEALGLAAEAPGDINLLLTDMVMPGINGRLLSERLRESSPELPVVFMSGYTDHELVHRGLHRDSIHFLAKPFDEEQLLAIVATALANG